MLVLYREGPGQTMPYSVIVVAAGVNFYGFHNIYFSICQNLHLRMEIGYPFGGIKLGKASKWW